MLLRLLCFTHPLGLAVRFRPVSTCREVASPVQFLDTKKKKIKKNDQTENEQFNSLLLRVVSPRVACPTRLARRVCSGRLPKLATSHNLCTL